MNVTRTNRTIKLPDDPNRSYDRVHVSGVLRDLAIRLKILKPGDWEDGDDSLMAIGIAWEDWLALREAEREETFLYHPGEFELDDIVGTPDGLSLPDWLDGEFLGHEFKFTLKSARHDPKKERDGKWWMWLRQGMAYLKLVPDCSRFMQWTVCHVNGSYEKGVVGQTVVVDYLIEFTEREIEENWKMLVANAKRLEKN